MVDLLIRDTESLNMLFRTTDWVDLVELVLEMLGLPFDSPCADFIEVLDEHNSVVSSHSTSTVDEMDDYNHLQILKEIDIGMHITLRLSSDPCLHVPLQERLEFKREETERMIAERDDLPS